MAFRKQLLLSCVCKLLSFEFRDDFNWNRLKYFAVRELIDTNSDLKGLHGLLKQ